MNSASHVGLKSFAMDPCICLIIEKQEIKPRVSFVVRLRMDVLLIAAVMLILNEEGTVLLDLIEIAIGRYRIRTKSEESY